MKLRKIAAITLGALMILTDPSGAIEFEASTVHTGFFWYYDLGVDPGGNAHVFLDNTQIDVLYYRNNVGGDWGALVNIGPSSDWGSINVSGTVDSQGADHVAYDGGRAIDDFTYATNRSGDWVSGSVIANMRWYSLDLGPAPDELPRAAYYDNYSGLNYCEMSAGGVWTHANVDNSGDVATFAGRYPDIVTDGDDNSHISYYHYLGSEIRYATNASGGWSWETVASSPSMGAKSWIALDPAGEPIVNYSADNRIWIARKSVGVWTPEAVTTAGSFGQSDVKCDSRGRAVVAYTDQGAGSVMLAIENDRGFDHHPVTGFAAGGDGPILQIRDDVAHVLAWNQNSSELVYLKGPLDATAAPVWETASSGLELSISPAIVRDAASIRFSLPRAASLRLEIFDVTGRLVWRMGRARYAAGNASLDWLARDDSGRPLASGVYLARARTEDTVATGRFLVLR